MNTFSSILLIFGRSGGHPANNTFAVCCVLVLVVFSIALIVRSIKRRAWDNGEIPANFSATAKNLFEIYISAACAMILRDPKNSRGKLAFLNQKLLQLFPNEHYDFSESYDYSIRTPLKIDGLCKWSNNNLNKEQKIKLLNFLAEVMLIDGFVHDNERRHLFAVISKMRLNNSDLDPEFIRLIFEQKTRSKESPAASNNDYQLSVLGLKKGANATQIKQAYRMLAKITHPDRFMNESVEVQEEMKRKFQEIQEAYEKLSEDN